MRLRLLEHQVCPAVGFSNFLFEGPEEIMRVSELTFRKVEECLRLFGLQLGH